MADFYDLLERALEAPAPPTTGPELVRYAGSRRALVQALTGQAGPPRRGDTDYDARRREWNTASRRVQRWSTDAGQRRGRTRVTLAPRPLAVLRRAASVRKREALRRHGMRARLDATITLGTPPKVDRRRRLMPAPPGPGVPLSGAVVLAWWDSVNDDEMSRDELAGLFYGLFFEVYGLDELELDEIQVHSLKVWPGDEAEPA